MKARDLKPGDRVLWSEYGIGHEFGCNGTPLVIVGHTNQGLSYRVGTGDTIYMISYSRFDKGNWMYEDLRQSETPQTKPWYQFW